MIDTICYYLAYHLPSKKKFWRKRSYWGEPKSAHAKMLVDLDRWNAAGRGEWQYHSCNPGYSSPKGDSYKWELVG